MSRLRLALLCLALALLAIPASAEAFKYRMRYGQAKHASLDYVKEVCRTTPECIAFGTGQCYRVSLSRFDCNVGTFYPDPGGEIECQEVLHWGASYSGFVTLKNRGKPHCVYR